MSGDKFDEGTGERLGPEVCIFHNGTVMAFFKCKMMALGLRNVNGHVWKDNWERFQRMLKTHQKTDSDACDRS